MIQSSESSVIRKPAGERFDGIGYWSGRLNNTFRRPTFEDLPAKFGDDDVETNFAGALEKSAL